MNAAEIAATIVAVALCLICAWAAGEVVERILQDKEPTDDR